MDRFRGLLASVLLPLCGCAAIHVPATDSVMCDHLNRYAATLPLGAFSSIRLVRGGDWMVNHYKSCQAPPEDDAGARLCQWLVENTSTEFMEVNVNQALSCLQNQTVSGYMGNTSLTAWSGSASFNRAVFESSDASLVVSWQVGCPSCQEDYLLFEFRAADD